MKTSIRGALFALLFGLQAVAWAQPVPCIVLDPDLKDFYYGPCENGFAHGEGHARGTAEYRGEFRNGRKQGKGVKSWPNGDRYSGEFVDDKRQGKGQMIWGRGRNEGERYDGEWQNDVRQGQGTQRWPNGDIYTGLWTNDTMADPNNPIAQAKAAAFARGPYFGLGAGRGNARDACTIGAPCDGKSTSYSLVAGYQWNRWLSAEVGAHYLGESQIAGAKVSSNAGEIVGLLHVPIGRFSPFAKLGVFRGEMRGPAGKERDVDVTFGGGLQYEQDHWALRAEYQYYREMGGTVIGGETSIDRASLILLFKFR
jgi:hypothetical protein